MSGVDELVPSPHLTSVCLGVAASDVGAMILKPERRIHSLREVRAGKILARWANGT